MQKEFVQTFLQRESFGSQWVCAGEQTQFLVGAEGSKFFFAGILGRKKEEKHQLRIQTLNIKIN